MRGKAEALEAIDRCILGLQALRDLMGDEAAPMTREDAADVARTARAIRKTLRPFYEGTTHRGVRTP